MLTGEFYKRDLENIIEAFDKKVAKKDRLAYDDWRRLQRFVNEMPLLDRPGTVEVDEGPEVGNYLVTLAYNYSLHGQYFVEIKINDCFYTILKENIDLWDNSIAKYTIKNIESITVNNHTIDNIIPCGVGSCGVDYATTATGVSATEYNTITTGAFPSYLTATTTVGETIRGITDDLTKRVDDLEMKVKDTYVNDKRENKTMDICKNFNFGKLNTADVRLSMYGLAVKNASGTWVSYDVNTGDIIDVDVLSFDGKDFLYQMPVAIKGIKIGDVLIHARRPMFVTGFAEDTGNPIVIDVYAGERKEILPTKSPFNFNFYTRVMNLMDGAFAAKPNEDNPFGNMWMLALMGNGGNANDMLPFLMMNGGFDTANPMLMYMMMKDSNGAKDMLPFLMMNYAHQGRTCGCHRDKND